MPQEIERLVDLSDFPDDYREGRTEQRGTDEHKYAEGTELTSMTYTIDRARSNQANCRRLTASRRK